MFLSEIATALDYKLVGDGSINVATLNYPWDSHEDSLAVVFTKKDVATTKARAVLAEPQVAIGNNNFVLCEFGGINEAILRVTRLMIDAGIYYDYEQPFAQYEKGGACYGVNVSVGEGTFISPLVYIGENVKIGEGCTIESGVFIGSCTEIGDNVIIRAGAKVGVNCHYHFPRGRWHRSFSGVGGLIIGNSVEIGANTVIQHGSLSDTVIGDGTIIGNLVEIAHDVQIGAGCLIISQAGICGNVTIGDNVEIYGQAGIANGVKIGDGAVIFAKSAVTKNVSAGQMVSGMFSRDHVRELRTQAKLRRLVND